MVAVLDAGVNGWREHELINNGVGIFVCRFWLPACEGTSS
jgi:hypothetical protein